MPKKIFTIRDFSGGINSVRDPRDIDKKEFAYLNNFYVDQLGALRPSGSLITHNGLVSNKSISSKSAFIIGNSGGRNLFYFESDHDISGGAGLTGTSLQFWTGGTDANLSNPTAPPPPSGL